MLRSPGCGIDGDPRRAAAPSAACAPRASSAQARLTTVAAGTAHQPPEPNACARTVACVLCSKTSSGFLNEIADQQGDERARPQDREARRAGRLIGARRERRARELNDESSKDQSQERREPREQRMDIGVPLIRELAPRSRPVREHVAELMHDHRRDRHQTYSQRDSSASAPCTAHDARAYSVRGHHGETATPARSGRRNRGASQAAADEPLRAGSTCGA